ncbi:methylated-DNA--[protein]-cysteine S-methyltransferase [Arthrobacter sp. zg-Y750]|uniref:methylated-DNA--[protein]-cysteine S-methyltransferase n=1 Tax=Arthrobacter sp. zg-Y750 TaxID=2894189 RepID=UPI001E3FDC46|nr:methylated-DNA--[protein]-cysteine S-methyltransferase [Arthrobacter sp. zg-Y750]MCC9176967.1 methylated-DNA--[protein]-cysteine S-methyltransferase [Arthrobacter sp. zg-Y750]
MASFDLFNVPAFNLPAASVPEPVLAAADAAAADPQETAALTALHSRLAEDAQAAGVLDVAYTVVDSPVGGLILAATDAGLVRVAFECEGVDTVLQDLSTRISPRLLEAPERLAEPAAQLRGYFEGSRRSFDLALDLRLTTGYRRTVVEALQGIAYGRTVTYAGIAALTGNPGAVRAVGTACGRNPLPLVIPCHRVLRSDGTTGGYRGGPAVKKTLLDLEAAA